MELLRTLIVPSLVCISSITFMNFGVCVSPPNASNELQSHVIFEPEVAVWYHFASSQKLHSCFIKRGSL